MLKLSMAMNRWIEFKQKSDPFWKNGATVIFSGPDVPGEGEHKVMDYMREFQQSTSYDSSLVHVLYGLDADLIMLGLVTHENKFMLLREKMSVVMNNRKRRNGRKPKDMLEYEREDFELLQLQTLRQMFQIQFRKFADKNSGFTEVYSPERIIDDFVFMCMLVGNDFLTHMPHMEIDSGALSLMLSTYTDLLPKMGGYLTNKEKIHPDRFEQFLQYLMVYEAEHFSRRAVNENEPRWAAEENDSDERSVSYRDFYYHSKLNIDPEDPERDVKRRAIVRDYLEGLHWVLNYYHNGCQSWDWFYPHLYSPLCTDMNNLRDFYSTSDGEEFDSFIFQQSEPFPSLVQLLSVLPPQR